MQDLIDEIDAAWEARAALTPATSTAPLRDAVAHVIGELDAGRLRVAEKTGGAWHVHQWIKKAVLLSFRLADNAAMRVGGDGAPFAFYDKVATKFAAMSD
ncbi:MAG: 2,3,4,5-tetrahydropyridine-2,6-dicarboxylate N-succinyltransferase, partial [Casimicrobiaceae bacterium]